MTEGATSQGVGATGIGRIADGQEPPGYRAEWEADVVLRDGSVAHVRPIVPADADAVQRFHKAQSEESVYLRFFAPIKELSEKDLHRFTHVDYVDRVALVVTVRAEIIGIARYDRLPDRRVAEVAFNISDHYQGKGVGSVLLEHLAAIGRDAGVEKFVADVLPQNRKMMTVFTQAGYEVDHHVDDGVIEVSFRIAATDRSEAVQLAREHRAEGLSIRSVLSPASVAVVGVSRRPGSVGSMLLDNIVDGGFTGQLYVVNSEADQVRGYTAYDSVRQIVEQPDQSVDLAIIAVPPEGVLDVADDCAAAGVRSVVVVSTGFAEAGEEGRERQQELLRRAREAGMRVVGPASLGIVHSDPETSLYAVLTRDLPRAGRLGVFTQSGGLGVSVLDTCAHRRLGISSFASAGNRVDVSGNDVMQFWMDDDATDVCALYLESVGNPRKFSRIARQLSLRKPVVVVKSPSGSGAPRGHRARVSTVGPAAFDALLEQAGVIPTAHVTELVDVAELVSHQPLPQGARVQIIGNSDGILDIVQETARQAGLVVREPVRLPAVVSPAQLGAALQSVFSDEGVDSVLACFVAPLGIAEEDVASALAHATWGSSVTCVSTFIGMRDVRDTMRKAGQVVDGRRRVVPVYPTSLAAVTALAKATRYASWRARDHGERVRPQFVDRAWADELVTGVLTAEPAGRLLTQSETSDLLTSFGIRLWPSRVVEHVDAAVAAAEEVGYPVCLRVLRADGLPPAGSGWVSRDLATPAGLTEAYAALDERRRGIPDLVIAVQQVAPVGVPVAVQSAEDPLFGPVVGLRLGGMTGELLDQTVYRIPPLTDVEIAGMVEDLRGAPLLRGRHGLPPADLGALRDLLTRVSLLADEIPELADVVLEPVICHPGGAEVVSARVRVAPASARADAGRRALT